MGFKYISGEEIEIGDVVKTELFGGEEAVVDLIILPHSDQAKDLSCFETGGVMFRVGKKQSLMLVPEIDEDFELMYRGEN